MEILVTDEIDCSLREVERDRTWTVIGVEDIEIRFAAKGCCADLDERIAAAIRHLHRRQRTERAHPRDEHIFRAVGADKKSAFRMCEDIRVAHG